MIFNNEGKSLESCFSGSVERDEMRVDKLDRYERVRVGRGERSGSDIMSKFLVNKKHKEIMNLLKRCKYHIS